MPATIHETALVHPGAELGDGVVVGPYCIVEDKVAIGDGTVLDAFSMVKSHTRMGRNNRVHSYACIGGEPQHLGFKGEETTVEIGDGNIFREYVTVHRGTTSGHGYSSVGSGCLLMAYVHVAHDCRIGNGVIMANASSLAGHVDVGDGVIISGMSGVHQFVRIGECAFLGAMGGFGQDIPPYTLATGVRAKLHGLNLVGLRRRRFPAETLTALKKAYQTIWRSDKLRVEALDEVEQSLGDVAEVKKLIDFLRASKRGVTPHENTAKPENGDAADTAE